MLLQPWVPPTFPYGVSLRGGGAPVHHRNEMIRSSIRCLLPIAMLAAGVPNAFPDEEK